MDEREPATGTLPAVAVDAVKVAFRGLRGQERVTLPATLAADTMAAAATAAGGPDVGAMVAAGALQAAVAAASVERATRTSTAPAGVSVEVATGRALDALSMVVAYLKGEPVNPTDNGAADAAPYVEAITAAVQRVSERQVNPRRRSSGSTRPAGAPRRAGIDLASHIREVLAAADGPVLLRDVVKTSSSVAPDGCPSRPAVDNRWIADNVDGVKAVMVDGTKAFALA